MRPKSRRAPHCDTRKHEVQDVVSLFNVFILNSCPSKEHFNWLCFLQQLAFNVHVVIGFVFTEEKLCNLEVGGSGGRRIIRDQSSIGITS